MPCSLTCTESLLKLGNQAAGTRVSDAGGNTGLQPNAHSVRTEASGLYGNV